MRSVLALTLAGWRILGKSSPPSAPISPSEKWDNNATGSHSWYKDSAQHLGTLWGPAPCIGHFRCWIMIGSNEWMDQRVNQYLPKSSKSNCNFFAICKGPENKYFKLCEPHGLRHSYPAACCCREQPQTIKAWVWLWANKTLLAKTGRGPDLACKPQTADPCSDSQNKSSVTT